MFRMSVADDVGAEIDRQVEFLHRCRSVFPRLQSNMAGQTEFEAPQYYRQLGYNVSVKLAQPMTAEFIDGLFELGHWLNENFVTRLWAILESNQIVSKTSKIDQGLENWRDVDLLRRLRNKIGHGSGAYDPADAEKKKLFDAIVQHYNVPGGYSYFEVEKYPIGVGQVLVPMAQGCKKYTAAATTAKEAAPSAQKGQS
jgi:hypothetical protein